MFIVSPFCCVVEAENRQKEKQQFLWLYESSNGVLSTHDAKKTKVNSTYPVSFA